MPNVKISDFLYDLERTFRNYLDITKEQDYEDAEIDVKILQYFIDEAVKDARVWFCADCDTHTKLEYYMVHNHIWTLHGSGDGMLCIGCLESRMGQQLAACDFTEAYCNHPEFGLKSDRLLDRLAA